MAETITLYRSEGNTMQEPTYRLYEVDAHIDARPITPLVAALDGLVLEDDPEHGGPVLCTPDGLQVWSVLNALAMGKLRIVA